MSVSRFAPVALAIGVLACSSEPIAAPAGSEWQRTVETSGNVTTVTTLSGSVWGGTATLQEELSMGVEAGEPHHMFGQISAIWATEEEIYVVDYQAPAVRVFDHAGNHLRDIGKEGQGPGEFERPSRIVVDAGGRVFVGQTAAGGRINVYSPEGETLDTWALANVQPGGGVRLSATTLILGDGGELYVRGTRLPQGPIVDERTIVQGTYALRDGVPEGEFLEAPGFDYQPQRTGQAPYQLTVPFSPIERSGFMPSGAWVAGVNDDYHFEIHHPGGHVVKVQRYWDPIPISQEEAAYTKRYLESAVRQDLPDWRYSGPEVPPHRPAFASFYPDYSGRVMVVVYDETRRLEDCDDIIRDPDLTPGPGFRHCWPARYFWDAFDLEGDYLGRIDQPEGTVTAPFFNGSTFLMAVEDEWGTIQVKKYRVVLPAENG